MFLWMWIDESIVDEDYFMFYFYIDLFMIEKKGSICKMPIPFLGIHFSSSFSIVNKIIEKNPKFYFISLLSFIILLLLFLIFCQHHHPHRSSICDIDIFLVVDLRASMEIQQNKNCWMVNYFIAVWMNWKKITFVVNDFFFWLEWFDYDGKIGF